MSNNDHQEIMKGKTDKKPERNSYEEKSLHFIQGFHIDEILKMNQYYSETKAVIGRWRGPFKGPVLSLVILV